MSGIFSACKNTTSPCNVQYIVEWGSACGRSGSATIQRPKPAPHVLIPRQAGKRAKSLVMGSIVVGMEPLVKPAQVVRQSLRPDLTIKQIPCHAPSIFPQSRSKAPAKASQTIAGLQSWTAALADWRTRILARPRCAGLAGEGSFVPHVQTIHSL
jgi:hypothetical protein